MKTASVNVRIEADLKDRAETILKGIGLKPSDAIRVFYRMIVNERGVPFWLRLPNETSKEALKQVREGEGVEYDSLEDLVKDAENW